VKVGDRNDWLIGLGTAIFIVFVGVLLLTWSWPFDPIVEDQVDDAYGEAISQGECSEYEFDKGEWDDLDSRYGHARDLDRCKVLIGLTEDAVLAVLGKPESIRSSGARVFLSGRRLDLYEAHPTDPLVVWFDEDGLVRSTQIRRPAPYAD
jgi:hypothetical protein